MNDKNDRAVVLRDKSFNDKSCYESQISLKDRIPDKSVLSVMDKKNTAVGRSFFNLRARAKKKKYNPNMT